MSRSQSQRMNLPMPKPRTNNLLDYLEAKGVLANGTMDELAAAKREYRKVYQREYKQRYRTRHIEVRFTLASSVMRSIDTAVKTVGIDRGTYAKEATLARWQGRSYGTDLRIRREVLQKVALIHSEVRHLCRQRPTGFLERRIAFDRLNERIGALEEALREVLRKDP